MSRELLQRALDVLDEATTYTSSPAWSPSMTGECKDVAAALRAALAQPEAKPVAWRYQDARGHYRYRKYVAGFDVEYAMLKPVPLYTTPPAQPAPVPVALTDDDLLRIATTLGLPFGMLNHDYCKSMEIEPGTRSHGEVTCDGMVRFARAVIAAAPGSAHSAPAVREPLTDTKINAIFLSCVDEHDSAPGWFARAIERFHGITGDSK